MALTSSYVTVINVAQLSLLIRDFDEEMQTTEEFVNFYQWKELQ